MDSTHLTFIEHVHELRKRILWVVLAALASGILAYNLRGPIITILQRPLGAPLYYTTPAGSFNFILKLSMVIGLFIALPVLIYQLLRFLEPALPMRIKKGTMAKIIGSSFFLALAGVAFGFFLMIPLSLHFFLGYSSAQIKPLITADEYLSFVLNHMLTFALAFQIPMIFLFINRIKPLKPSKLLKYQRHVIVAAFGLALILPFTYDPLSQFIVAIPIVVLFYLSVVLLWFSNRKLGESAYLSKEEKERAPKPVLQDIPRPATPPIPLQPRAVDGLMVSAATTKPIKLQPKSFNSVNRTSSGRTDLSIDGISPLAST